MAVLAAIALIVANASGVILLRSYLVEKVDQQLQAVASAPRFVGGGPGGAPGRVANFPGSHRLGPDYRIYTYNVRGTLQPLKGPNGNVVPSQEIGGGPDLGGFSAVSAHANGRPYTVPGADGSDWRVVATTDPNIGTTSVVAVSMGDIQRTSDRLIAIDAIVTLLMLMIIVLAAASVVRIGLRPLTRMEETAAEIAGAEDLGRRVEDTDPHTESGRLGTALNAMLVRIEAALAARKASEQRLRQFLADASHELRTPLTSIQGFAELYRRGGTPPGPELDEAMGRIESETARMRVLVNDLLQLARLDEERPMRQHPVDLLGVAAETVRDAHVRVPTRFVQLAALDDAFDTFEPVTVLGDDDRLRQVATNLVSNALQHTGENTRIVVRVGRPRPGAVVTRPTASVGRVLDPSEPVAVLEVADSGAGMSADVAERVFERLYRAERSRDRRLGGAGLGLSIVAGIVQAHGGRVELTTAPGAGSTFRVVLPAIPLPDDLDDEDDSKLPPRNPSVPVEPSHS
ncbi:MAG TPA: HAMP domain-containing sensor histidine kinase [Micromonosporaceae bacterium]|jgi:two-component system OmpR family sensor kinase